MKSFGKKLQKLGSARRSVRSVARASEPFDANAIDGDNDGTVQEGTAFERPATPSVPSALTGDKGPKSVPRKGPYSDRPVGVPKRRRKKLKERPTDTTIDEAVGDPRAAVNANVFGKRVPMHRRMTKQEVADVRNRLVGLKMSANLAINSRIFPFLSFRPNSDADTYPIFDGIKFSDSILNTFSPRVREIVDGHRGINFKELEAKYGKLDTVLDLQAALKKAYPNTGAGSILINFPITQQMFKGRLDTPMKAEMFFDEIDPSMAAVRFEMLKMLQWADSNPRTASSFTNLEIGNQNPQVKDLKVGSQLGHMGRPVAMSITDLSGEYTWSENLTNLDLDRDATTFLVSVALGTIMKSYTTRDRTTDNQGRPWNVSFQQADEFPPDSIQGLLAMIDATHEHEFGHAHWFSGMARGIGGDAQSWTAFGETRQTSSAALAAARKQYAELGVDDPDELIRQVIINGWREMALNIKDLENRQEITRGSWAATSWADDAKRLEDATDPDEIRSISSSMLDKMKSYGMSPGFLLFAPISGRGLYSKKPKQGNAFMPMNTTALQVNDNPFNMPAFVLYRMFEKADIDISLSETKQLLKEALRFMSDRSQYGSVSVAEAFAELYSFKALGYLKESHGAPWKLLQLFEESFEAIGGKSLAMLADVHAKSLNKIRNIRKTRKIRKIVEPFDGNAVDADGDGMVQDGTVNERPALAEVSNQIAYSRNKKRRSPQQGGGPQGAKPRPSTGGAGDEVDQNPNVVNQNKVKTRSRISKIVLNFEPTSDETKKKTIQQILELKRRKRGEGFRRTWNKNDTTSKISGLFLKSDEISKSPFSIFSERVKGLHKESATVDTERIEKAFGKIESIDDLYGAFTKALPELKTFTIKHFIDPEQLEDINSGTATSEVLEQILIDSIDQQMLNHYTVGMRLLEWSLDNPETAKDIEILEFGPEGEERQIGDANYGGRLLAVNHDTILNSVKIIDSRFKNYSIAADVIIDATKSNPSSDPDLKSPATLVKFAETIFDHESMHISFDVALRRVFGNIPEELVGEISATNFDLDDFKKDFLELLKGGGFEDPEIMWSFMLAGTAQDMTATMRQNFDATKKLNRQLSRNANAIISIMSSNANNVFAANSKEDREKRSAELEKYMLDNGLFFPPAMLGGFRGLPMLTILAQSPNGPVIGKPTKLDNALTTANERNSALMMVIPIKKLLEGSGIDPQEIEDLVFEAGKWIRGKSIYGQTMWQETLAELFAAYKVGTLKKEDKAFMLLDRMFKALELSGGKSLRLSFSGLKFKVAQNG